MTTLRFWEWIYLQLASGQPCGLLVVVDSKGSSPGRTSFKMAVSATGEMAGSIGGGIMEHKLVELVMERLRTGTGLWELRRQVHRKDVAKDQSGMICSGEQTNALLVLPINALLEVESICKAIRSGSQCQLEINDSSILVRFPENNDRREPRLEQTETTWKYSEMLGRGPLAHVIGAGHVGLAMCQVMAMLDYYVINYDDRPGLNTLTNNVWAHEKLVLPYPDLAGVIQGGPGEVAIIMTFGYRGDNEAVRALLGKQFAYLGMMGSATKVAKLINDLRIDGYDEAFLETLHAPAGIIQHGKTPASIAISIAAEILGKIG